MTEKTAPTFNVDIHMAGDITLAAGVIQRYASGIGMCVSLAPQSFIYTGGREEGFRVGFINYPRFPKEPGEILARARDLASVLRVQLGQHSYSIVTPIETIWVSTREEAPEVKAELLSLAETMAGLEDAEGLLRTPTRAETKWAREVIEKAKAEGLRS